MPAVRAGEVGVVVADELSRLTGKGAHDALEVGKGAADGRLSSSAPYGTPAGAEARLETAREAEAARRAGAAAGSRRARSSGAPLSAVPTRFPLPRRRW
ncbi:hypothetical protein [Streptomyces sp. NPDC059071]|uniref:hypothetical protein n=1 Tax=unclassified Streptomyces TaxID=2593676 RepID=UPI00365DE67D